MVKAWLAYLLTLLCGGAFYLLYPLPLSFYTLLLLLVLPLLSLGLTALSLRRLRLDVTCDEAAPTLGGDAFLRLSLSGPRYVSGVSARLTCRLEHKLYPQLTETKRLSLSCNTPLRLPLPTGHCGWLAVSVARCSLSDWMGLFSFRLKPPPPTLVLVWPKWERSQAVVDLSPAPGRPMRPRPGGGPGEDYELRPYRPGDAVTSIHWKLTAKRPDDAEPVLRETLEPVQEAIAVTYDHFGDPDTVDGLLGQLNALEHTLLEAERPFTLCWADPESGRLTHYTVDCPDSWQRCWRTLAGLPAPLTGQGVPEGMSLTLPGHSGPVRRIHLKPEVRP